MNAYFCDYFLVHNKKIRSLTEVNLNFSQSRRVAKRFLSVLTPEVFGIAKEKYSCTERKYYTVL